jgi:hypothetical protein
VNDASLVKGAEGGEEAQDDLRGFLRGKSAAFDARKASDSPSTNSITRTRQFCSSATS